MKKYILLLSFLITGLTANIVFAQTTLDIPTIGTATRPTLTGFTANWTPVANATSYSINVYDGASALVTGSPKTVTGATSATLAITAMLNPNTTYSYTVTAIGDGVTFLSSIASANSTSFTTATSTGTYKLQYAVSDIATLSADIKGGAADIYELTESGGAYTFTTTSSNNNNAMIRNTTIRAASGLAVKPIFKIIGSGMTSSNPCMFYSITPGLTIKFDGLEFDGINSTSGATQPQLIYCTTAATDNKVYISNCKIHDFLNVAGNGVVRMDGVSSTGVLDIQGTTFNNCGGRMLYINEASGTTTVNIKNCTFSNNQNLGTRANIVYNSAANGGTQMYDHCTFYNILVTSTSPIYIKAAGGAVTIKNCIFSSVQLTQSASTAAISNCYVGGFATPPTITSPITTAPIYSNAATLDFSLTNRASLVGSDGLTAGNASYYPVANPLNIPTTGAATSLTNVGFTANWTNGDSHATSFTVKTYIGGVLATTSSASSGSNSLIINGLMAGVDYTYTVSAVGDGISYGASAESSPVSITTTGRVASISTDMNDGTWGTALLALPANGSFGTTYVNGFVLNSAVLYAGSSKDSKGSSHTNRISLDKSTYGSCIILPTVNSIGQLEIHGSMGTAGNGITVKELNTATNTWTAVGGTYVYELYSKTAGSDSIYIIPISRNTPTTLKIENASTGSGNIWQIITRTTNPSLLATPTISPASSITASSFTASWSSVTNASNYEVKVYKGTTLKVTANTTAGQATTSLAITGLQADSTYTYKVKAIGDGDLSYSDSYQSVSSAQFTMAHQLATPVVGSASASTTGITANWSYGLTTNVLSYDVKVYQGTTLVKTANVADPNATTININGLEYATEYTFTVTAIGDNSTYYNSAESSKSTPATTDLGTGVNLSNSGIKLYVTGKDIICSQVGDITVYNIQGEKVMEANAVNKLSTNLNNGLYLVRFTSKNGQLSLSKLIIK